MKFKVMALGMLVAFGAVAGDFPAWNKEWGLMPQIGRNGCLANSMEEADIFVTMLLHKGTYEWAAKKCGANLNDVLDASAKVSRANKFFDSGLQRCYSSAKAKTLKTIASNPPPNWTCNSPYVKDSVIQYKKILSMNLN